MKSKKKILVFTDLDSSSVEQRAARPSIEGIAQRAVTKTLELSSHAFASALSAAYASVVESLKTLPSDGEGIVLESVAFTLGINAEGQVGLSSTSGKLGSQIGIEFNVKVQRSAHEK